MKRIPVAEPDLTDLERSYLMEAFDSGWISSRGSFITRFEELFSSYIGSEHAITCSNGTVSLHLILEALGISRGDEVIVPSLTYVASVNAIRYAGAEPVFIDIDKTAWNLDPERLEEALTERTRAIMGVHLYGNPMDMKRLEDICSRNSVLLIEDSAEAIGSEYRGKKVGSFGIAGSFSFFGNKTVTTGEGGMVVTDDDDLAEKILKIKNQGNSSTRRYWHDRLGYNYRMTNLQAAVGVGQMERVEDLVKDKIGNARSYSKYLDRDKFQLPSSISECKHSHWMYTILVKDIKDVEQRDRIMAELERDLGIETRPMFYPIHMMNMYNDSKREDLSVTEDIYYKGITLPSSTLLTEDEIRYISRSMNSISVE